MNENVFSPVALLWQLFNLLLLLAVFVFLGWRVFRVIRRAIRANKKPTEKAISGRPLKEVIRGHRISCHMTQEFVAEALGVSRQAVSKWESGAAEPSTANLLALAKLFDTDAAEMLKSSK